MAKITRLSEYTCMVRNDEGSNFIVVDRLKAIRQMDAVPREVVEGIMDKLPNMVVGTTNDGQDVILAYDIMRLIKESID